MGNTYISSIIGYCELRMAIAPSLINQNVNTLLEGKVDALNLLAPFQGKFLILYFYPKDMTSGCTTQAIEAQSLLAQFETLGAVVCGASKDSLTSHERFSQKYDLSFPLLSDTTGELCEAFGVWVEKSMYGKKYFGIERSTFMITPEGDIINEWRKAKVPGHWQTVLSALKEI